MWGLSAPLSPAITQQVGATKVCGGVLVDTGGGRTREGVAIISNHPDVRKKPYRLLRPFPE